MHAKYRATFRLLLVCAISMAIVSAGALGASAERVKIMTLNIHRVIGESSWSSINAQRLAHIVNYFEPDVLCINELEGSSRTLMTQNLQLWANNYLTNWPNKYVYVSTLGDGYNRNAFVSKYPYYEEANQSCDPRGLVSATFDIPGDTDVRVFCTHLKAYSDSTSCNRRQNGAETVRNNLINFSAYNGDYAQLPYFMCGDFNEDEDNPSCTITSSYHPVSTIMEAYLNDYYPDDGYGDPHTYSSSSPTRRFDYVLPSWHVRHDNSDTHPYWSRVINTYQMYLHGDLPPGSGLYSQDSWGSDHLAVIGTFEVLDNEIASLKAEVDGEYYCVSYKPVTASYSDHFYIQEADSWNAVRVNSYDQPPVGAWVNVKGTVNHTAVDEDSLDATGVRVISSIGANVSPIGMGNRSVTPEAHSATEVDGKVCPSNAALLVKVWGEVTSTESGGFTIDDGSGYEVFVESGVSVNVGDYVSAVGVVGYSQSGGTPERYVKTRISDDIQIYNP